MSKKENFVLILILGALCTISPFSIDMYLPGFPAIAENLNTSIYNVQLSLTAYLVGIAIGQLFYGPLLDKYGRKKPLYAGAQELSLISMPNSGKSFSQVKKEGKSLIVGYEHNALDAQLWSPEAQNPSLYEKGETGYIYEPASGNLARFNLYPDTWKPRAEQKWVGMAYPLIQVAGSDQVVAVLPKFGNQLFYYTLSDRGIQPLAEIELRHPERDEKLQFDVKKDDSILYPFFSRLTGGGNYFLVEFQTAFPRGLYESFRAKGENFNADPEYWEELKKHHRSKYILTDTKGNQAAISELPVPGVVHLMDADDIVYIKPTTETELDYNVFYRYRVSME